MPKPKTKTKKIQIDGQNDAPLTVGQLLGETGLDKYNTLDEKEYENKLNGLNKTDLQEHAIKIGLIPIDNRLILTQRLMREFKKHVASYSRPRNEKVKPSKYPDNKIPEDVLKILSAGR